VQNDRPPQPLRIVAPPKWRPTPQLVRALAALLDSVARKRAANRGTVKTAPPPTAA
jgi:hypothetical protein